MTPNSATFGFLMKIQKSSNLLKMGIFSNCKFSTLILICGKDTEYYTFHIPNVRIYIQP